MIAKDFCYIRPDTKEEAVQFFNEAMTNGLMPMYYGGGSEIITMCRAGSIAPDVVIDLKGIYECNILLMEENRLVMGGCTTLRAIRDSHLFPLLGTASGRIADHTNQCRITLGGNLCGTIIYRETVQALLITGAELVLYGPNGERTAPINAVFDKRLMLKPGEFVMQVRIGKAECDLPYWHVKKTAGEKIDYPLISLSAVRHGQELRMAISGYYAYPFRNEAMEAILSDEGTEMEIRLDRALNCLTEPPMADYQASGEYRRFVLKSTLAALMKEWDG